MACKSVGANSGYSALQIHIFILQFGKKRQIREITLCLSASVRCRLGETPFIDNARTH